MKDEGRPQSLSHEFISTFESLGQSEWLSQARVLAEKTVDFSTLEKLVDEGRLTIKSGLGTFSKILLRIDMSNLLQNVILREIEKRDIFTCYTDRVKKDYRKFLTTALACEQLVKFLSTSSRTRVMS